MKIKTMLSLLLAALVILAGAWLPQWAGKRQDASGTGQINYTAMKEVRLEFAGEYALSMEEKVATLAVGAQSVEVSENLTTRSQGEILIAVKQILQSYAQAGLIQSVDELMTAGNYTCSPRLFYREQGKVRSNIFWEYYAYDQRTGSSVRLCVDDQTGALCFLEYARDQKNGIAQTEMTTQMESLCRLFLEGLGEDFQDRDIDAIVESRETKRIWYYDNAETQLVAQTAWTDALYGQIRLNFVVSPWGFYTNIY